MRKLFRRRVSRLFALPISVLLAGALLASCSQSGGVTAATSGSASGEIKWAYTSEFPSWDPVVVGATGATQLLSTIYEPLFTLDAQGKVQPALATGWEYNSAGTDITVTLRPGLTFQDGSPLNAGAVAYNVQRLRTQQNSALKALWQDVVSATVVDDTHVRLNLKQANYQIPFILANRSSLLASERAAKADATALNTNSPVGAGPFKLVKLNPGASVTLEKWDGYWAAKDIHVKRITISLGVNPATVLSGLQTGVYNFATNFSTQNVALAKKSGLNVVADVNHGWGVTFLNFNVNKAPFDNPKVVQAVQSAINRKQLVGQLGFGLATPTVQPFPSTSPAYNPALDSVYTYDQARAKRLLAEAGHQPGSLTIELNTIANQSNAASELIQQQLQDVGINVKITAQPISQFYTGYYGKTLSFTLYGWVGRDSLLGALDDQFGPGGILNLSAPTSSPQYAAARLKVLSTPLDAPNYKEILQAATRAGVEGGSTIALYSTPNIYVTAKSFSAFPVVDGSFRWIGLTI